MLHRARQYPPRHSLSEYRCDGPEPAYRAFLLRSNPAYGICRMRTQGVRLSAHDRVAAWLELPGAREAALEADLVCSGVAVEREGAADVRDRAAGLAPVTPCLWDAALADLAAGLGLGERERRLGGLGELEADRGAHRELAGEPREQ